jgi:class 3 adenylate cyclase
MQLKDIKHMNMDSMKEMVAGDDDDDAEVVVISTRDSWTKCTGRRQCTLCCKCSLVVQEIRQLVYTFIKLKTTIENIGLFIPVDVLQKSIVSGERIKPTLAKRDAALMLCKFRDFEGMVAALSPNEMAIKIEQFHNTITTVLERDTSDEKGVVLDFIGDAVLTGWNVAPKETEQQETESQTEQAFGQRALHAVELSFRIQVRRRARFLFRAFFPRAACTASPPFSLTLSFFSPHFSWPLRVQDAMEELRKKWSEEKFESHKTAVQKAEWQAQCGALAQLRIGIHACRNSEGLVGNCGSDTRMKFMALGSGVNLTSRLQFLNDYYGTLILISKQTLEGGLGSDTLVANQFVTRPVDVLRVSGFEAGVTIYEVMDRKMNPAVKVSPFLPSSQILSSSRQWSLPSRGVRSSGARVHRPTPSIHRHVAHHPHRPPLPPSLPRTFPLHSSRRWLICTRQRSRSSLRRSGTPRSRTLRRS